MFEDNSGEPFNPFMVGPTNHGARTEFQLPSYPTYPPPVFATWPASKVHTNTSVSKSSLPAADTCSGHSLKSAKSRHGGVELSRAINEEMTASKGASRIHAGGASQLQLSANVEHQQSQANVFEPKPSEASLKTLLAVKSNCTQDSVSSKLSLGSRASSVSTTSRVSKTSSVSKSISGASANTLIPKDSKVKSASLEKTLQHKEKLEPTENGSHKTLDCLSLGSRASSVSKTSRLKSGASANTLISMDSKAESISKLTTANSLGKMLHHEEKLTTKETESNKTSSVSKTSCFSKTARLKSGASANTLVPKDSKAESEKLTTKNTDSNTTLKSSSSINLLTKISEHRSRPTISNTTIKSADSNEGSMTASKEPAVKRIQIVGANLSGTYDTLKAVTQESQDLATRLRAGEDNYRRFSALTHNYCYNGRMPLKKNFGDRISEMFKDDVLS